jgi:hypothetical protein
MKEWALAYGNRTNLALRRIGKRARFKILFIRISQDLKHLYYETAKNESHVLLDITNIEKIKSLKHTIWYFLSLFVQFLKWCVTTQNEHVIA